MNNDQATQPVKPVFQDATPVIPPLDNNQAPQPQPQPEADPPLVEPPQAPNLPPQKPIKGWQGSGGKRKKIIATIFGALILVGGIGAGLILVGRRQEPRVPAAPAGSQEELFGETWTRSQCEALGGSILDFEDSPSLSGKAVDPDTWNVDPYNVTITNTPTQKQTQGPYLAKKGSPRESFEGPSKQSCPADDWQANYRDDQPKSDDSSIIGSYWLTDDGTMNVGGWGLTFEFTQPILGFGGYILDVDANEWHVIHYYNESGQEISGSLDQVGDRNYLTKNQNDRCAFDRPSDGSAKGFEYGVRQAAPSSKISKVVIDYNRIAEDPTYNDYIPPVGDIPGLNNGLHWGNPGLGYDFLCIIPTATVQQTQSPSPTPTPTNSPTPTVTATPTQSPSPTATPIGGPSATPTPTATPRVSIPATVAPIPVSGSLTPTLSLATIGIGLFTVSFIIYKKS